MQLLERRLVSTRTATAIALSSKHFQGPEVMDLGLVIIDTEEDSIFNIGHLMFIGFQSVQIHPSS